MNGNIECLTEYKKRFRCIMRIFGNRHSPICFEARQKALHRGQYHASSSLSTYISDGEG